jgi:hypothetical protein
MELDQRAHEEEMAEPSGETMRMSAATAGGAGGNTFTPEFGEEEEEDEPSRHARHSGSDASGWEHEIEEEEEPSGLAEHEQEQAQRLHSRRAKVKFHDSGPWGVNISRTGRYRSASSIEQGEPVQGAYQEMQSGSIDTLERIGHLSPEEAEASRAYRRKWLKEKKALSDSIAKEMGGAQSKVNTRVDDRVRTSDAWSEAEEASGEGAEFQQRLLTMDAEGRKAYYAAHRDRNGRSYEQEVAHHARRQRVRHARKVREQQSASEWVSEDEPERFNKAAALACARQAINTGRSYEDVVTDFARAR